MMVRYVNSLYGPTLGFTRLSICRTSRSVISLYFQRELVVFDFGHDLGDLGDIFFWSECNHILLVLSHILVSIKQ